MLQNNQTAALYHLYFLGVNQQHSHHIVAWNDLKHAFSELCVTLRIENIGTEAGTVVIEYSRNPFPRAVLTIHSGVHGEIPALRVSDRCRGSKCAAPRRAKDR